MARLKASGARIVSYVPDHAFVVSVPAGWSGDGLGLVLSEAIRPEDKWSPLLTPAVATYLIEFHADVSQGDARIIAGREGLRILDRPDLRADHLMVQGSREQVRRLKSWDEVEYIFPASAELAAGQAVQACGGAITEMGAIGQVVGLVGDGWDGPGANAVDLTFAIRNVASSLGEAPTRGEIVRALEEWSRYVRIQFSNSEGKGERKHIDIRFASRDHSDPYPFDGPGRVLAHTFYPAPPNPEPVAGDMHFDDDEIWRVGADIDVYSVALHELGHALGLGHSDSSADVMYAYYRRSTTLAAGDIAAVRQLYATRPQTTGATPPDVPPSNPASPTPPSPTPASPTPAGPTPPAPAPPPSNPTPTPPTTPPAEPPASPDRTAPAVTVTTPSGSSTLTNAAAIAVRGGASDNVGVTRVTWTTAAGASGTATGTTAWSAEIPLLVGINHITIRAYDAAGNSGWRAVVVTRR